jgi:hypothetical protein
MPNFGKRLLVKEVFIVPLDAVLRRVSFDFWAQNLAL